MEAWATWSGVDSMNEGVGRPGRERARPSAAARVMAARSRIPVARPTRPWLWPRTVHRSSNTPSVQDVRTLFCQENMA